MNLTICRWMTVVEETPDLADAGAPPLRKVAVAVVLKNPYAGHQVADLGPMIKASAAFGPKMAELALAAMHPYQPASYGKGGVVGVAGEQEHINALITSTFADPLREKLGGGVAWISSFTKRAGPGCSIDIPLAHKDALYVRSHYDGMTVTLQDGPLPDEVVMIFCIANRGRIGARVGGLAAEDVEGKDGLR